MKDRISRHAQINDGNILCRNRNDELLSTCCRNHTDTCGTSDYRYDFRAWRRNVGDILTFANEVYDETNIRKLGTNQGYCMRQVVGKSFECHWTVTLSNGQIMVDGPFYDTADSSMAITGGTGIYSGARGEMLLHARDAKGTSYDFTFKVKP